MNHNYPYIPTYIIDCNSECEHRQEILKEFENKSEFSVASIDNVKHENDELALLTTIKFILNNSVDSEKEEFILFCKKSHRFADNYSSSAMFNYIASAKENDADILLGSVDHCETCIEVSNGLFAIDTFFGFDFLIIFKKFYSAITSLSLSKDETIEKKISKFSDKKFLIFPFLSVKKDQQNKESQVANTLEHLEILRNVGNYYAMNEPVDLSKFDTANLSLPVYVINLKERTDRKTHIIEQFVDKQEFEVNIIEACQHKIGTIGLWESIKKIIKIAIANDDDLIIICEDDHQFTSYYDRTIFFRNILEAYEQGCDILAGGICKVKYVVPLTSERYWISSFWGTQFFVVFRKMFHKILEEPFKETDAADDKISIMTSHKMTLYPFISTQKEFGYSDATPANNITPGLVTRIFKETDSKFKSYQELYKIFSGRER